jgi:ribonuclease HI
LLRVLAVTRKTYKDIIPNPPPHPTYSPPLIYHTHHNRWNPKDYIYTNGSQVAGNPILGAAVVSPARGTTIHIRVNSNTERHTINRGELAAITVALQQNRTAPQLYILTDSSFCINSMRNYALNPSRYHSHLHEAHLHLTDTLLRERELQGYHTHIWKVKSHTGIRYNDH